MLSTWLRGVPSAGFARPSDFAPVALIAKTGARNSVPYRALFSSSCGGRCTSLSLLPLLYFSPKGKKSSLPLIFFRERQGQGTLFLPLKKVKHQQCSLPLKKVGATGGQGQDYCTVRGKEKKDEKSTFFLPLLPLGTKLFSKTLPLPCP
jgi:hypothetical protein